MENISNKIVLDSLGIPIIQSFDDFINTIGLSPSLIYLLTRKDSNYKYDIFEIDKKSGGKRVIYAPKYSLKLVQKWVLHHIFYKIKPSEQCFAYKKGLSNPLKKNAEKHKSNGFVLTIDIKDFFPSFTPKRVFGLFSSIGYNREVAALLTNICTYDDHLPQGAVTSPCISNLLCRQLDYRLQKYCAKRDITFTRYADDLYFSSNDRQLLKKSYTIIVRILKDEGFEINSKKTHFMSPKTRTQIAGVTISDGKLKAPKEMKRKVRSMIHRAIVTGDYSSVNQIKGYIAYINSIEINYKDRIIEYIKSFKNRDVTLFKETIDSFNENKIFNSIEDFVVHSSYDMVDYNDAGEHESYVHDSRESYLKKIGIIK